MSSETITRNDLANILNEVLPPVGSKVLYSGAKVSSGTITLSDAYTNYDFLHISYVVNSDRFAKVFDCNALSANPTSTWAGDVSIYGSNNVTYMSDCYFTVTDSTHLSVSNTGNNANFIAGIYKIVGITSHDAKSGIAMDYIVEQGTDGIWTYRKWNSGIAECWGYKLTSGTFSAWGSGYSHDVPPENFPTGLFTAMPYCFVSCSCTDANSVSGANSDYTTKDHASGITVWRGTSLSGSHNFASWYYAKGTWK